VDVDNLKSLFSSADGILTIEVPLKNPPKIETEPKEIPVNRITSDSGNKQVSSQFYKTFFSSSTTLLLKS
jgi:hypothetical protein